MRLSLKYSFLLPFLILFACGKDDDIPLPEECDTVCNYLFLGHIYETSESIDQRIEGADLSSYSQIWLGGDICSETTQKESTLNYLDSLFNLSSNYTHWALGNHDIRNGNLEWITSRTGRETFYSYYFNGITLIVLNTNYIDSGDCTLMEEQTSLIQSVCDTISASSHLVLLMHNVVWGGAPGIKSPTFYANANASWIPFECNPPKRFIDVVYPQLLKAKDKGVEVVCIAGDMGQTASTFEQVSDVGIVFIGSGITSQITYHEQWPTAGKRDSVLVLTHDLLAKKLSWEFIDIDNI